ncbi:MAG: hypothetical protein LBF84_00700 [Holosporales bacterium]|jgi:two-component system nitrogen regulation response regulator GlnG|nr:hypothetical protein [Holosporales bacterium]
MFEKRASPLPPPLSPKTTATVAEKAAPKSPAISRKSSRKHTLELGPTAKTTKAKTASKQFDSESNIGQLVFDAIEKYFQQHHDSLPPPGLYKRIIDEVERPLLFLTLKAVDGNQQKAAQILGINRNTLRKKIARLMRNREGAKALQNFAEEL